MLISEILNILEKGLKDDGKSFYTNEEKAEMIYKIFNKEGIEIFDKGWTIGYDRGVRDSKSPSCW